MCYPNRSETEAYFQTFGFRLVRIEDAFCVRGRHKWVLHDEHGDAFSNQCDTLLALWNWWMELAAYVLCEDAKLSLFLSQYRDVDKAGRRLMRGWIRDYMREQTPTELKAIFAPIAGTTTDYLPEDWKPRLAQVLRTVPGHHWGFGARVYRELRRID